MIDIDTILTRFVKTARLPTYSPALSVETLSGLKNVYLERPDDVAKANYPYILVDLTSLRKEGGWIIDDTQVDVNDNVIYSTNYELLITYHVYGKGAMSIANQLEGFFRFESTRDTIKADTGGVVVTTFPIESAPQHLADKYVESSLFSVLFAITDSAVDSTTGVIDVFTLDSELIHAGYDKDNPKHPNPDAIDDPSPLPVAVNIDYTAL